MSMVAARPPLLGRISNPASSSHLAEAPLVRGYAQPHLVVTIAVDDGRFFAIGEDIATYGEGDNPNEALRDLLQSLVNLHGELSEDPASLAPELDDQLRRLEALGIGEAAIATP